RDARPRCPAAGDDEAARRRELVPAEVAAVAAATRARARAAAGDSRPGGRVARTSIAPRPRARPGRIPSRDTELPMTTLTHRRTPPRALALAGAVPRAPAPSPLGPSRGPPAGAPLVTGLRPPALIAAGVALSPRLRPGARATLALFFGALALIMGTAEAGYYT